MASAWGLSWAGSWSNSWGVIAEPQPAAGGGPSQKSKGWLKEREQLEESLRAIELENVRDIAIKMAQSNRPQAKRIARKLVDYSGELKQAQSLDRELAKLELIQKQQVITDVLEKEKEKELTLAALELKEFLQEETEILETYLHIEQQESQLLFRALGLPVF